MDEDRKTRLSMQKTCFIFTVNLGHICKKTDWNQISEDEKIEELEMHWEALLDMPNLKIARGQIERNKNGELHINGGVVFKNVTRGQTLQNKWHCWADPARNKDAVMQYGKKMETRVHPLENFGVLKVKKTTNRTPKQEAVHMLMSGLSPREICQMAPDVYFTHHRAINETYKMMLTFPMGWSEEE